MLTILCKIIKIPTLLNTIRSKPMKQQKQRTSDYLLTKVDVMPAKAPAESLATTDSSPFCPVNNFCKSKNRTSNMNR